MTSRLFGYDIGEAIGRGGMATVYRGLQVSLQRPVAIKFLQSALVADTDIRRRFEQESMIIARLSHPNIIQVIDQGYDRDGCPYFVMEYVKGVTLDVALKQGVLSVNRCLDLCVQVCKGLSYAHRNGVIHRDIKPGNIIVDYEGHAKILDFGIALARIDGIESQGDQKGDVMGTYAYMAPEQRESAGNATIASDIYALGVVMYQMFSGQLPRQGRRPGQINPALDSDLDGLIMQCVEPEPEKRPASIDEVRKRLLHLLQGNHIGQAQRQRASQDVTKAFVLLDIIKENEFGSVYLFEEKSRGQLFVIKKKPVRSGGYEVARSLVGLNHPHVAVIHGSSRNDRTFILVMEYLNGGCLADRLSLLCDLASFYRIALEICEGMAFAHERGIVHGNLRPSNVLFNGVGQVKLVDFGLERHYREAEEADNWYQCDREEPSFSGDIYSAGVIFLQMLTGELPERKNYRLQESEAFAALPEALKNLLRGMLALDPRRRPASFTEIAVLLQAQITEDVTVVVRQPPRLRVKPLVVTEVGEPRWHKLLLLLLLMILLILILGAQGYLIYTGHLQALISRLF